MNNVVDVILEAANQHKAILDQLRSALESGNDAEALKLARTLCGLSPLSHKNQKPIPVQHRPQENPEFFSIAELAVRWRCSRGTVYSRLRATGLPILDFAKAGKKGRKVVAVSTVTQIESAKTKRLR